MMIIDNVGQTPTEQKKKGGKNVTAFMSTDNLGIVRQGQNMTSMTVALLVQLQHCS